MGHHGVVAPRGGGTDSGLSTTRDLLSPALGAPGLTLSAGLGVLQDGAQPCFPWQLPETILMLSPPFYR